MKRISNVKYKKEKYNANKIARIFLSSPLKLGLAIALNFIFFLIFSTFVFADGWDASKPSHGTLYADTITSKTIGSPVNVADSLFVVEGITTLGNVGIGTTGPDFNKLRVTAANNQIGIEDNAGGTNRLWTLNADGNKLHITDETAQANRVSIDSAGNVGIGTTGPGALLDIQAATGGTLVLSDPGIAHGMTVLAPTNVFGQLREYTDDEGGFVISGYTAVSKDGALLLRGIQGVTDPTDSHAGILIQASKKDGTSVQVLGALETVLRVDNLGTNPMVMLGSGNVGIGTNTVDQALDVYKSGQGTSAIKIKSDQYSGWPGRGELGSLLFGVDGGGSGAPVIGEIQSMAQGDGGYSLLFRAYGSSLTDVMSVLGSGNVGIGTTNPGNKLHVEKARSDTISSAEAAYRLGGNDVYLFGGSLVSSPYSVWMQAFRPSDDAKFPLVLNPSGGNVGIGTTNPNFKLEVAGSAGKPGGGSWSDSSDIRLKKNIKPITNALDKMLALNGVTYQWKEPQKHGNLTGNYMGMIANDVEKSFPEWVGTGKDGYKTLGFIGFEALTVESMRELKEEIDRKNMEIQELKSEINEIKTFISTK